MLLLICRMKPTVVTLTAIKHRLDGSVTTAQKYSDIVVFARLEIYYAS